ncbi:hypothetical protein AGRA3207_007587 [Actinomadura graeca]|uniref:Secreted protein n=1 Tax=Actinomadura graeca TaxID=2750812 RepID=A0ABX8R8A6_9ACTN|nr:PD-(D/E)XK nuclease family protein [Actinomadura graeca]QXJ26007.1 hypothetical protein AGRA3207_007587 [Actinomadura graeca]
MTETAPDLDRLRGGAPPRNHDARTIAALTANPGCARRGVMDAAGVDKDAVARHLGFPAPFGQSQFAITRGNAFEAQVKADGCAELLTLLRDRLGLAVAEAAYDDLEVVAGNEGRELRHARTRRLLARALETGEGTLFDHPLLRLEIGGRLAYLEPDVIAFQVEGRLHVIEVKSFAVVDGQAEPEQVAAAARQSAVYVLALRRLAAELGHDPGRVSHEVFLVCPENFSNRPTATPLDVRPQLAVLERQLARLTRVDTILEALPEDLCFEPGDALADSVRAVEARYAPECIAGCEMAFFCRDEARACGATGTLGRGVRDDLGGIDTAGTALALADGSLSPSDDLAETAAQLRTAARLRDEALAAARGGAA